MHKHRLILQYVCVFETKSAFVNCCFICILCKWLSLCWVVPMLRFLGGFSNWSSYFIMPCISQCRLFKRIPFISCPDSEFWKMCTFYWVQKVSPLFFFTASIFCFRFRVWNTLFQSLEKWQIVCLTCFYEAWNTEESLHVI